MYLTAQLVRRSDGETGVNAFAFVHGNTPLPLTTRGEPDVGYVAEHEPGRCVAEQTELTPGGNSVDAYLDVAARDHVSGLEVQDALQALARAIPGAQGPWTIAHPRVAARLHVSTTAILSGARADDVFVRLQEPVLTMLGRWESFASNAPGPYVIWLRALPGGLELSFPPATRSRLRRSARLLERCFLPSENLGAFPGGARRAIIESALAFLGRGKKRVRAEGGLRFVDPETLAELFSDEVGSQGRHSA
jgi:hypothetical protein